MKRPSVPFPVWFCLLTATAFTTRAQLVLNEIGGTIGGGNYSTLPTTAAFGRDEIGGGGLPIHKIPNVRDGIFGNSNSWIGDSLNSFVGLNFGANPVSVGGVAWGRDNTANFGDRTAGTYLLQFTTDPNPGAATENWTTIGSVNYLFQNTPASPISMSRRHLWSFPQVNATGIRLTAPGSSFADGACIDELEAYTFAAAPMSLVTTGGSMDVSTNIGLNTTSTAFARDLLGNGSFAPTHTIPNLNDGVYGNSNSWIGNSESSFAGLDFNGSYTINRAAWGRDNTGTFGDRSGGTYQLQYTTTPDPDASTPDSNWITIGPVYYDHNGVDSADRHEYGFSPVTATGLRLFVAGNGLGSGIAIDEFEAYAVPEPAVAGLALLTGAGLLRRRRSFQAVGMQR